MRPKAYPLEAARSLRTRTLDAAKSELALTRARAADAAAAHAQAAQAVATLREARTNAVASAAVSGAELALAGAYSTRLRLAQADTQAALDQAAVELRRCARAVRLAELKLSHAYIEREVIERHHARFAENERKRTERAAEAELDDLIPHRRLPSW
jgi:CTP synthase (UTP-ammonia lyase)